jgi:tellurite resistance protein TehA-like permease
MQRFKLRNTYLEIVFIFISWWLHRTRTQIMKVVWNSGRNKLFFSTCAVYTLIKYLHHKRHMLLPSWTIYIVSISIYSMWEKKNETTIISRYIMYSAKDVSFLNLANSMLGLLKQTQQFVGVQVKLQGEYLL